MGGSNNLMNHKSMAEAPATQRSYHGVCVPIVPINVPMVNDAHWAYELLAELATAGLFLSGLVER